VSGVAFRMSKQDQQLNNITACFLSHTKLLNFTHTYIYMDKRKKCIRVISLTNGFVVISVFYICINEVLAAVMLVSIYNGNTILILYSSGFILYISVEIVTNIKIFCIHIFDSRVIRHFRCRPQSSLGD